MVHLGSVPIDSGSGLSAEVPVPRVETERTDAVFAADTLELDSPFDPVGGVVSHSLIVVFCLQGGTHHGWDVESNLGSSLCEYAKSLRQGFAPAVASDKIKIRCPALEVPPRVNTRRAIVR